MQTLTTAMSSSPPPPSPPPPISAAMSSSSPPLSPTKPPSPPQPIFFTELTSTPPTSTPTTTTSPSPLQPPPTPTNALPPPTNAPPPTTPFSLPPLPPPPPLKYGVPPPPSNQVEFGKIPPPLQPQIFDYGVPPPPEASGPSLNGVPIGVIVLISVGVAGGFFAIALILWFFCYVRKSRSTCYTDCESPQKKDNFYDELPQQYMNKDSTSPDEKCFRLPFKIVRSVSRMASSSYANSNMDENSPRAQPGFGCSVGNFTYEGLAEATHGFSKENLLGEGGFGYVHKGVLQDRTKDAIVAVKQLKEGSKQGDSEFQAEVETITRVHHRHLVSLVGFCIAGRARLLVYEYVNNKTLHFHLHGKEASAIDWPTRLKVAIGSAKGIAYLHEDCNPTIIHRDIKASNILIDSHFEAKVSDFGFAKEFSSIDHYVSHISTRVVGTFGYLAPEYAQSGQASDKSDVFSFGVVLLELITGRQPILEPQSSGGISLVSWAKPLLKRALEDRDFSVLVDPRLQGNYNREEVANMAACAASCVRSSYWRRPRMSQILRALEGGVSLADQDEGVRPLQSAIYKTFNRDNSSVEDTIQFGKTFPSQENARYSSGDSTNEKFGFYPSSSDADAKRPLQRDDKKKT